ncbi:MAG: hypothetical protein IID38_10325, partial [Planctomycetes bacterium]|nr:hypothetical protein [Planctomycetota bacterium]
MMKFFRKYNKHLLVGIMTLLMIVFMGGAALEGMFNTSGNRVVARSRLGDITEYDQRLVAQATRPMEVMGIDWRRLFGGPGEALQEVDWILLVREAEEFGTRAGESSARNWFQTDTQLDDISRRMSIKPARVLQAVADYRSILQTAFAVADSAAPSAAAVAAAARDALEAVRINAVALPAEAFSDPTYEPGSAELEAQFEAYRSQEAGTGLNFGYYQQPEVQVQFIEIDRDAIATQITLANLDRRAKSYFERERTTNLKFRRPADEIRLPPGVVGPPQDPYLSWEEAVEIAKEGVRIEQADRMAEQIANRLIQYTSEAWLDVERGEDGYKVASDEVSKLDYYDGLVERLTTYPDAIRVRVSEFFTRDEAGNVAGIGNTFFVPQRAVMRSFASLAFLTKVAVPKVPTEEGVNAAEYMALFQTGPYALTDIGSGNLYVFRPVDVRPGHSAESVDEV